MWGQEFAEAARPSMKVPRQARRARRAAERAGASAVVRPGLEYDGTALRLDLVSTGDIFNNNLMSRRSSADGLYEASVLYINGATALSPSR